MTVVSSSISYAGNRCTTLGLPAHEPDRPVTTRRLPPHGDLYVAPNRDPHGIEAVERVAPVEPLVFLERHFVDDHIEARERHLADRPPVRAHEATRQLTDVEVRAVTFGLEPDALFGE